MKPGRHGHLFAALAAMLLGSGKAGLAETALVYGGEHPTFTRIVVQMGAPSGWRFGKTATGYGMRLARQDITLDTSRAFDLIPRDRLRALNLAGPGPGLDFAIDCPCHATALELQPGILVIDINDGPAPASSPFETALSEPPAPAAGPRVPRPLGAAKAELNQLALFWGDVKQLAKPAEASGGFDITRDYSAAAAAETFDITRDYSAAPTEPSAAPSAEPIDVTRDYSKPAEPAAPPETIDITKDFTAQSEATDVVAAQAAPAALDVTKDQSRPAAEAPPAAEAKAPEEPFDITADRSPEPGLPKPDGATDPAEGGLAGLPLGQSPDRARDLLLGRATTLRPTNPRVAAARNELLTQISRAATQGLLDVAQPELPLLPSQKVAPPKPAAKPATEPMAEDPSAEDHMTLKAETSIDRDSLARREAHAVTPDGLSCLPDSAFDLPDWGDDRPISEQLTEKRQALVGEFATPPSTAIADLAKLYLYFGFGAEASGTLRAYGTSVRDADLLLIMAESLDNGSATSLGRLKGMADCDTSAALWAVLATPRLAAGDPVNVGAVVRTFSGLPLHLRRQIGPVLAERFINMGNEDAGRTLRDAITRASGEPNAETRLVNARLDLGLNKTEAAEAVMKEVVAEDGDASPEALILLIDTQIEQGVTVDQATVTTAAALAFEHRGTELGSRLARAEVLSKAASDDFNGAFATLALQTRMGPKAMPTELDEDLFGLLLKRADDATFLRHMLGSTSRLTAAELPRALRQGLADRMVSQGFPEEAQAVLAASERPKPADKLVLAKIALAEGDAGAALRYLEGLDTVAAAEVQAEAMSNLGLHAQAAEAYARSDQPEAVATAGWLAGDNRAILDHGTEAQKAALAAIVPPGGEPPADAGAPALGPLARNRALLADSEATRNQMEALLAAFPAPESAARPDAPANTPPAGP